MLKRFLALIFTILFSLLPIAGISVARAASANLIANPSVETLDSTDATRPQNWNQGQWGAQTSSFSIVSEGHTGKAVNVTTTDHSSGDAKWYFDHVTVTPGQTYTFSDYYKSTVASDVVVEAKDANNQLSYAWLGSANAASSWTQLSYDYTAGNTTTSISVFHLINTIGSLTTDDYSLVQKVPALAPTISFTSPTEGATVSNTVNLSVNVAAGSSPLSGVQYKLDNQNLGAEVNATPYTFIWDTNTVGNGSHTLQAVVRDSNGLSATTSRTVTVQNTVTTPPTPSDPTELIPNNSAETVDPTDSGKPASWASNNWGTNTANFTYESAGHTGSRSVKTQISQYTSGDAKWYFNPVPVESGKTYTFSDYYKATVGGSVIAQLTSGNGTLSYQEIGTTPANTSWTNFAANLTTNADTKEVSVFHVIAGVGWLQLDDVSLKAYTEPTISGFVANNSLETAAVGNNNLPADWQKSSWGTNTAKFHYVNEGHTGSKSVKVNVSNYVDGDAKWYFNPISTLQPGKQYRFSVWYKTNTIPHAVAMYLKNDGTEQYFGMPNPQPGSNKKTVWQQYSDTFTVPIDAKAVSVFMFVSNNGWVQTDDYTIAPYQPVGFNRPLVSLTFDDGFEENNQTVLPMMESYGYKSTQCYSTQFVQEDPANPATVLAFKNAGHEICSHTITHPFLTKISASQLTKELKQSQSYLQNLIGAPVQDFASPYGDYDAKVITQIKKYYRSHRTVDEGYNSKDNFDIYRIRVQNLQSTTTMAEYQSWLDQAKATNTWLVLVYHKVWNTDIGQFDTYTSDFAQQLKAIHDSGLTVKTYSSALDEVTSQL